MGDEEGEDIPLSPTEKTGDYGASTDSLPSVAASSKEPDQDLAPEINNGAFLSDTDDYESFMRNPFREAHDAEFWTEVQPYLPWAELF